VPDAVDWVRNNKVSAVKSQGDCGSCWAFASVSTIETAHAIASGELLTLSEAQVLDCADPDESTCDGGYISSALEFAASSPGLVAADKYAPYTQTQQTCVEADEPSVKMSGWHSIDPGSTIALQRAVARGSVVTAISASSDMIQHYGGGVLNDFEQCCPGDDPDCSDSVDHAVVVVGYNATGRWWLVRNSWGSEYGEDGYLRLTMDKDPAHNMGMCGILSQPARPFKAGSPETGGAVATFVSALAQDGNRVENGGLADAQVASAGSMAYAGGQHITLPILLFTICFT
jgi:C1A family cysteine protease